MTFFSFSVYLQLLLLIFFTLTTFLPSAAGAPLNATIRLDSPLVSFTPGWRVATFGEPGQQFAFANGQNEELQIVLPQNITAVFYQGFTVTGGALYFTCIDCRSTAAQGPNIVVVDAHDDTENGTQPPKTLFSFTDLDPTVTHLLTVVNLEDDRFNHTSQITFDSLIMTVGASDNSTTSGTATIDGGDVGVPTITVTASSGVDQSSSVGGNPNTAPALSSSQPTGSQTGIVTVSSGTPASVTGTATATPPASIQVTPPQSTGTAASASSVAAGPSPTSSPTESTGGNGSSQTSTSAPGAPQTTGPSSKVGGTPTSSGASGSATSGVDGSQPTTGSVSSTSSALSGSGTSGPSNNGAASSGGVSKTVIIVVAVVASLVVIFLLVAIVWLLARSQPPPVADLEGGAPRVMREAPATISGPMGLAPMRPQNPFADIVPAHIPLDEPSPMDEGFVIPSPRLPPPRPSRSPLRITFDKPQTPAWINRVPRTPSPTSPIE